MSGSEGDGYKSHVVVERRLVLFCSCAVQRELFLRGNGASLRDHSCLVNV